MDNRVSRIDGECLCFGKRPATESRCRRACQKSKQANHRSKLYDESYALVIGNSNYLAGWDNPAGVASDVVAVSQSLERHGFKVEISENLTRQKFDERLRKFIDDHGFDKN